MDVSSKPKYADYEDETDKNNGKLNEFAPAIPGRMMVVGSSGSGKTRVIRNLVEKHLAFDYLFVLANHIYKKDYTTMRRYFEEQEEKIGEQRTLWTRKVDDMPNIDDLDEDSRNIMIIDDMMNEDKKTQRKIAQQFIAGRKGGTLLIAIVQSFIGLDKNARRNVTDILLFGGAPPIDEDSLKSIHKEYCRDITDFGMFKLLYQSCVNIPYGFLYIDLRANNIHQKYRYKFDCFLDYAKLQATYEQMQKQRRKK